MAIRRCRQHGTVLLDVDSRGEAFRKPTCLECVPPHRPGCLQLEYVEKQAFWLRLEQSENPDADLTEQEFWERFDWVPECRCPERKRALDLKPTPPPAAPPAPAFQLAIGRKPSGYTYHTLRPRLGRMISQLLGKRAALHWELEQLAAAADVIPAESARTRARAILKRLQEYELDNAALT